MDWRERLLAWLQAQLPSAEALAYRRFSGMPAGASNDTIGIDLEVTVEGGTHLLPLVFRPQRTGGILAPYDVARQFRVQRALAGTAVPVAPVLWLEETGDVVGVPFYFMARVPGETLPLFWYGGRNPRLDAAAGALAAIHGVDWRACGLEFLRPAEVISPLAADLAPWQARMRAAGLDREERLAALIRWLRRNEPADARLALLHGDPNPGNYLCRGERVVAVLDWELAALGDPRSDLGFYAALASVFGGMGTTPGRSLLSEAYEGVTGQRLGDLAYYEALGLAKMAVVMAGWGGFGGWGYGVEAISRRLEQVIGTGWTRE